ncbi:MAG: hypothetical protein IPN48_14175 [Sphingomonadales bacterium]|nr:hypothetical protein [Sphingomonadales bacterium]
MRLYWQDTACGAVTLNLFRHCIGRLVEMLAVADEQEVGFPGNRSMTWAMIGFPSTGINGLGTV